MKHTMIVSVYFVLSGTSNNLWIQLWHVTCHAVIWHVTQHRKQWNALWI